MFCCAFSMSSFSGVINWIRKWTSIYTYLKHYYTDTRVTRVSPVNSACLRFVFFHIVANISKRVEWKCAVQGLLVIHLLKKLPVSVREPKSSSQYTQIKHWTLRATWLPAYPSWFNYSNNNRQTVQIVKLLIMYFSLVICYFYIVNCLRQKSWLGHFLHTTCSFGYNAKAWILIYWSSGKGVAP